MSAWLLLASLWTPRSMMIGELAKIEERTNAALDALLASVARSDAPSPEPIPSSRDLDGRRERMAKGHERRVQALVIALGREEAIRSGREAMFRTGLDLGREARGRLKVRDDRRDLIRAARVLYRILGIEFRVVASSDGQGRLEVVRCALSPYYSREACLVLSAVDEGVVSGLWPGARMTFKERMTEGRERCRATIEIMEAKK